MHDACGGVLSFVHTEPGTGASFAIKHRSCCDVVVCRCTNTLIMCAKDLEQTPKHCPRERFFLLASLGPPLFRGRMQVCRMRVLAKEDFVPWMFRPHTGSTFEAWRRLDWDVLVSEASRD